MFDKKKAEDEVGIEEFFGDSGFEVVEVERPRRTFGRFVKLMTAFVAVSVLTGMTFSLIPILGASAVVQAVSPAVDVWNDLPENVGDITIGEKNTMYDKDGNVFAEIWTENRSPLSNLNQISTYAKKGLIDTEDQHFYTHGAFDAVGTARALVTGKGGGSGITQQLIKNLRFYDMAGKDKKRATEHSISRKIQELKYSIGYEKHHSKNEILLTYFNTVAFGGPSTYSIESASQYFFGKSAKNLDLAESAVLVGSVNNPVKYDLNSTSDETKEVYKARQKAVLNRMVIQGDISQAEADKAFSEPLKIVYKTTSNGNCASSKYPFYCSYVLNYLRKSPKLGETQEERDAILSKGGLKIKTYLDANGTNVANKQLEEDFGNTNRVVVPVAVVQPGTGGVSVIAANRGYGTGSGDTTINMGLNKAGTGSTYKMMTLAAALNAGMTESQLDFSSYSCPLNPGSGYDVPPGGIKNSSSCALQGGKLNYKRATAFSSNTWFATLEMKIGVNAVKKFSKSVGLSTPDNIGKRSLSYTLGVTENSPVDMAAAFATFANKGVYCPATPVSSYEYADGTTPVVPDSYKPSEESCRRVMSPHSASVVLKAMRANVSGEIPRAFGIKNAIPGYVTVAKSGTNEMYNSAWAQLTGNMSMFANMYDPVSVSRGMDYALYRGNVTRWYEHPSANSATAILTKLIKMNGYKGFDFNNSDTSMTPVPVEQRDFFTVPSVVGMTPSEAVSTVENLGMTAKVSKTKVPAPDGYGSGVIVQQSLTAGTQLPVGTKKGMILFVSE